ncbi:MAG: P-loop NTPase [Lentisphaerae bacterium]|jgi:MinD superfamily P-loop ATPase|nr:P-loop NTPase [Lentisphaerota bacterium]MBT4823540.1 P-loop NTPase [Lentisphaerota bacterium]MBT5612706.1 P-loop NTPase [Lentisphaerota bacterium]MBT7060333.1 P-loop NTPase [Lentisphaerota bacterium]MBT7845605.1 P-loop NTPase [Lentisphaerota bacterium]
MRIVIASGKGGTGKTTFAVNLAYALGEAGRRVRLLDCDVEEPNGHLFVRPTFTKEEHVNVLKPQWNEAACTGCGECAEACKYNAIAVIRGKVLVFNELCHSCGACSFVCPQKALLEAPVTIGTVQTALEHTPFSFVHGTLHIAESLAPAVVKQVKKHVLEDAINIVDASPGTACPVVVAVEGADVAILVTEPTPFGLNDLKLAVGLTLRLGVPTGVLVNRSDGTDTIIADYAEAVGVPIVGRIPFRRDYAAVYSTGGMLAKAFPKLKQNLLTIFERTSELQGTASPPVPAEESFPVAIPSDTLLPPGNAPDYKEVTVISGKGGTGKTTVVASLAELARNKVLADNDVDAADLHLLLTPQTIEAQEFIGGATAAIDPEACAGCGRCADACHFDAIRLDGPANDPIDITYRIDEFACEGCGLCAIVCPVDAVETTPAVVGTWFVSETSQGPMVHAKLGIAEENSGRLVAQVRQRAAELAQKRKHGMILGDGPPGTGCPVIASVSGADLILIVTEPTVSGVHDMERVLQLAKHFGVPARVVINKADLNNDQAEAIEQLAEQAGARVIARIPFDRRVNDALMAGQTVVRYGKGPASQAMHHVWKALEHELKEIQS